MVDFVIYDVTAEKIGITARKVEMPSEKDDFFVLGVKIDETCINFYFDNRMEILQFVQKIKEQVNKIDKDD